MKIYVFRAHERASWEIAKTKAEGKAFINVVVRQFRPDARLYLFEFKATVDNIIALARGEYRFDTTQALQAWGFKDSGALVE